MLQYSAESNNTQRKLNRTKKSCSYAGNRVVYEGPDKYKLKQSPTRNLTIPTERKIEHGVEDAQKAARTSIATPRSSSSIQMGS